MTQGFEAEKKREAPIILLVGNDEDRALFMSKTLLGRSNCRVLTAKNGAACLKISRDENPDVIVLDSLLADTSGLDLCAQLKKGEQTGSIPVILLVGSDREIPSELAGSALAPDDYLVYSTERHKLGGRIRTILRIREQARSESRLLSPFIAHKLRSPLNSIIGMAELIQKPFYGGLSEKQLQFAQTISTSGNRLLDLINELEGE